MLEKFRICLKVCVCAGGWEDSLLETRCVRILDDRIIVLCFYLEDCEFQIGVEREFTWMRFETFHAHHHASLFW